MSKRSETLQHLATDDIYATVAKALLADDAVNGPKHYDGDACMVAIETALGPDKAIGFCLGNAIKYLWRAGKKDPEKEQEDRQKAMWYMDRAVQNMRERGETGNTRGP